MLKNVMTICALLTLMSCVVSAQPPQRMIVGFDAALALVEQTQMKEELQKILGQPVNLVNSSSEQRWVIELSPALDSETIAAAISRIQKLPKVGYVEMDRLMRAL